MTFYILAHKVSYGVQVYRGNNATPPPAALSPDPVDCCGHSLPRLFLYIYTCNLFSYMHTLCLAF